jgi:hypothetical protein
MIPTTPAHPASLASTTCNGCINQSRQRTGGGGRNSPTARETAKRSARPSGVSSESVGTIKASAPPLERRVASSASSFDEEMVGLGVGEDGELRAISKMRTGRPVGMMSAIRRATLYGSEDGFDDADWRRSSNPSSPSSSNRCANCCCFRLEREGERGRWRRWVSFEISIFWGVLKAELIEQQYIWIW